MATQLRTNQRIEFGDFQTPPSLAQDVCRLVAEQWDSPRAVLEPTCGRGEFLVAACATFPSLKLALGVEISPSYVRVAREALSQNCGAIPNEILEEDFFGADWDAILARLPDPLLVIGNPPWVTNSAVGALKGSNLPTKTNFQQHPGLDALTGKSNFDISEWMLLHLARKLQGRKAVLAMLCKTAVARKLLLHGWRQGLIGQAEIRRIDAKKHFDASVDACLLFCRFGDMQPDNVAKVFPHLTSGCPSHIIGLRDNRLVSNIDAYEKTRHFCGGSPWQWRSGIKHDCARVMELERIGNGFQNGLGELVELEEDFLFPMLKSSTVASGFVDSPSRWMIVTQQAVGQDTRPIAILAPKTWSYLQSHASLLNRRASSIYRGRPPFAIFGVGEYSFAPYKVAVSGLYKRLSFTQIAMYSGRPIVLDDTCSMLACRTEAEARFVVELLASEAAQSFFEARIFWDAKRPITNEVLNQLNLLALANEISPKHPITTVWNRLYNLRDGGQQSLF